MSNTPIELKGSNFTLSVLHLYETDPERIREALENKIAQAPAFLKNAPLIINVATLNSEIDWQQIQQVICQAGLRVVGVSGCQDEALRVQITQAGLALLTEGKTKPAMPVQKLSPPPMNKTQLVDRPVRSGQRIYAPQGDLIITGQVSAGAELIADGNIHIYGMMRGRALAGAAGDKNAQIFSSHLAAELVSIAGVYWLSDQIPENYYDKAVRLCLTDGALTIESLN